MKRLFQSLAVAALCMNLSGIRIYAEGEGETAAGDEITVETTLGDEGAATAESSEQSEDGIQAEEMEQPSGETANSADQTDLADPDSFEVIQETEEVVEEELVEVDGIAIEAADSPTLYGFVTRMYEIVLGRAPDLKGYGQWCLDLYTKDKTAADIVHGFFFSQEYLRKNKSNEEIVRDYYKTMLNREPDTEGAKYWASRLTANMTMDAVAAGFVGSNEFKGICGKYDIDPGTVAFSNVRDTNYERTAFVYRLYKNCLNREPDVAGLEDWVTRLKNGETGINVAYGFVFSKEYLDKKVNNETFVTMLYQTILGREPEAEGKTNWVNALNSNMSRIKVFNGFLLSEEFSNACKIAEINPGEPLPDPDDKKPEPTPAPTPVPTVTPVPVPVPTQAPSDKGMSGGPYILNTKSKIFHHTWCSSVSKMSNSNKAYSEESRNVIIQKGYSSCQRCNP